MKKTVNKLKQENCNLLKSAKMRIHQTRADKAIIIDRECNLEYAFTALSENENFRRGTTQKISELLCELEQLRNKNMQSQSY